MTVLDYMNIHPWFSLAFFTIGVMGVVGVFDAIARALKR